MSDLQAEAHGLDAAAAFQKLAQDGGVRAMGFKPLMTERMLPGTVYWLDLTMPSGSLPVPLKDVSSLQPGGGSSAISVQPCSTTPSPAVPSPQVAPAPSPVTPTAPAPRTASRGPAPAPVATLPECKPGGGEPVPCVVLKVRAQPSVL